MLLALDTATRAISLALHDGSQLLAEMTWHTDNHHTVELSPALDGLMRRTGVEVSALTALAVTLGPGSYTGLRIGMSFAKGLALAALPALPLIGVPTLDVVAEAQPHLAEKLITVAQAGRGRINAGHYEWQGQRWQDAGSPTVTTWQALLPALEMPTQIAGEVDATGRQILAGTQAIIAPPALGLRRAGFLAEIALRRLGENEPADAATLAPVYLS